MTMTAMHHLADTGGRYAIISMCLGSGMGMATLIENLARERRAAKESACRESCS